MSPTSTPELAPEVEVQSPITPLRTFSRKLGLASAAGALASFGLISVGDTGSGVANVSIVGLGMVSVAGLNAALTGQIISVYRKNGRGRLLSSSALLMSAASISQTLLSLSLVLFEDQISYQAGAASIVFFSSAVAEVPLAIGLALKAVDHRVYKARLQRDALEESDAPTQHQGKLFGHELNKGSATLAKAWGAGALLSLGMSPFLRNEDCCRVQPLLVAYGGISGMALTASTFSLVLYDLYRYQETKKLSSLSTIAAVSAGQLGLRVLGTALFASRAYSVRGPYKDANFVTGGTLLYGSILSASVSTILATKAIAETVKVRHQKKSSSAN